MIKLVRKAEVLKYLGIKKSSLSNRIHDGLFPPPINIGLRAIAWAEHEVEQVIKATVAGKDDTYMRALVNHIVEQRKDFDSPV